MHCFRVNLWCGMKNVEKKFFRTENFLLKKLIGIREIELSLQNSNLGDEA